MPTGLDPARNMDFSATQIYSQIYETLVTLDSNRSTINPCLAERWDISADQRIFTFHLKPHILFHDGSILNAEAAVYSFSRMLKNNSASPILNNIDSMKIIDSLSLCITLKKAYPNFLLDLTSPYSLVAISPDAINSSNDDLAFNPAGTGPFKIKELKKDEIKLIRFNEYHGKLSAIKTIIFKYYSEQNSFYNALRENKIDILFMVAGYQLDRLKWLGQIDYKVLPPYNTVYLGFNNHCYPFNDIKTRRAVLRAINTTKLALYMTRGNSIPAKGPLPPNFIDYDNFHQTDYNLEEAKKLINYAHYPSSKKIKLFFPEPAFARHTLVELLKSDLDKIGITLDVKYFSTWEEHNLACKSDSSEMFINIWESEVAGDAGNFLSSLFQSNSDFNVLNYKNKQVDAWLEQASIEAEKEKRDALYERIVKTILDDVPAVFLYHVKPHFAYNKKKIKKLPVNPYNIIQYHGVVVNE